MAINLSLCLSMDMVVDVYGYLLSLDLAMIMAMVICHM